MQAFVLPAGITRSHQTLPPCPESFFLLLQSGQPLDPPMRFMVTLSLATQALVCRKDM